jgi:gliding-associated putative ABC transporter substrate-binding component GldG
MKTKKSILNTILLIVGVVVLINFLAQRFFMRLDLTEDRLYTLDKATKNILRDLQEPVTVTAYFSKKLPPMYTRLRQEFKNKLEEFANVSKGKVVYEFVDPLDSPEIAQEARQNGIMELQIQVMDEDEAMAQKAFMGAVIKMGDQQEVLPVIQGEVGMEYDLARSIKKLSIHEKPSIAILQGHGEPGLQKLQQVYYELGAFYNVQTVYLNDTSTVLDKYSTLLIIAPKDTIPPSHLEQIDAFVRNGNNLFIAINTVGIDGSGQMGEKIETGLPQWLQQFGVMVNSDYVVDVESPVVTLQRQIGPGQIQYIPVKFYYYPNIINFEDHPITGGIDQITFQFLSTLSFMGDSAVSFVPLIKTSRQSGTKGHYSIMELTRNWGESDFPLSNLTVGAAVQGAAHPNSKMVVIADGDFPVGDDQRGQINPENLNLVINSVDWLSDDTGLVGLRTKGAFSRPIEKLEDGKEYTLIVLNLVLPILLIIIIGIIIRIKNKNIQNKRREEGYV